MKKYLVSGLSVLSLVVGLGAVVAFAETTTPPATSTLPPVPVAPMVLNIDKDGHALLRGQVTAVGTDTLTVKAWGMSWTVNILTTTQIISTNKALTDIAVDDFVGVLGDVAEDGTFNIAAKVVRKWGQKMDSDHNGIPDNQDNHRDGTGKLPGMMGWGEHKGMFMPLLGGQGNDGKGGGEGMHGSQPSSPGTPVVCATDTKMCSDGTAVSRVAPKCEFMRCPESTSGQQSSGNDH